MKNIIFFGKSLLMVVLPVLFAVVSSIAITTLFAFVGALIGHNTFINCFQHILGGVTFFMSIVTLFLWLTNLVIDKK
jgi:hypothetical protein